MTRSTLIIPLAVLFISAFYALAKHNKINIPITSGMFLNPIKNSELLKIKTKAASLKTFASQEGFSVKYCFLADMSLPSGKKRFFIYDLIKDSVIMTGMVAHGSCGNYFLENVFFSNNTSCGCTSYGRYKIGGKYTGRFGKAYKLYGLDSSNSNAFKRAIVLHAYKDVPDKETYPQPIGNSLGCAMVSYKFLDQASAIINQSKEPVLLWIFN